MAVVKNISPINYLVLTNNWLTHLNCTILSSDLQIQIIILKPPTDYLGDKSSKVLVFELLIEVFNSAGKRKLKFVFTPNY